MSSRAPFKSRRVVILAANVALTLIGASLADAFAPARQVLRPKTT
jgi:hypothetical protein